MASIIIKLKINVGVIEMKEIENGIYLWAQDEIIQEQKTWDDKDDYKNFDFTKSDMWVTTNNGVVITYEDYVEQRLK